MHHASRLALVVLAALAAAAPAVAQLNCEDYAATGWPPARTVALPSDVVELAATDDGRLLAAAEIGVLVYDLAAPLDPVLAGFLGSDAPLREVAVDGTTVAALTTDGRLLLGVLTTPAQSRWVGELPLTGASLLELDDGLIVVRQLGSQLATIDVSDPKDPQYLGFLQLGETFNDLRVGDGLAYLAAQFSFLTVCSLANPALPEIVGTAGLVATATALDVEFPRARLANVTQVITYDLSVPSAPVRLGTTPRLLGVIEGLAVDRDRTFAFTDGGHIHHLATAGPDSLAVVGHTHGAPPVRHMVLADSLLYVIREARTLEIYDPAGGRHPAQFTEKVDHAVPVVEAHGDYVYALDSDHPDGSRLVISEIDPGRGLVETGLLPVFGEARAMDLQGERLVYSTDQTTVAIIDISDPAAPSYINLRNDDFFVRDIALLRDLIGFVGLDNQGNELLVLIDRRSEPSLFQIGALRVPFATAKVVRSRDNAIVQTRFDADGIMFVELSVPSEPVITDWLAMPAPVVDVISSGEFAFVLTAAGVVEIVSLADPSRLTIVDRLELDAGPGSLALVAATLLVQDQNTGITVVDVSDPTAARIVGATWVPTAGRVLAGTEGLVVEDVFNRQRTHLPVLCGAIAAVGDAPRLFVPGLVAAPNPFNPRTELGFVLDRPARVELVVYDLAGRRVRTLADGRVLPAGRSALPWDGRDAAGRAVAAGVYLARLQVDRLSAVAKLVLVR